MIGTPALWVIFHIFVLLMLALDLGVFHKEAHEVSFKEAVIWSVVWVTLALAFNFWITLTYGQEVGIQFLTGYLIEKSLSIDNIFVFIIIFNSLRIPQLYQHRVLFWGILGALAMRAVFIFAGLALLERFHFIIYVFGLLLIFTGVKMALPKKEELHPEDSLSLKILKKLIPVTNELEGEKFLTYQNGKIAATPLLAALILVETTDLIFAVDSIPAILAVTRDPFVVYTSNVFAILGLRSLYFALVSVTSKFHLIHYGLAAVLLFVGSKMMLVDVFKFPAALSLGVIAILIGGSVVASLIWPKKEVAKP